MLSGTITLSGEQLQIGNDTPATDLSIQGPGARTITVSANEASRVFLIGELTNVTISGLTVSDGSALFGVGTLAQSGLGGGIYNEGTLELNDLTVSGNTATPNPRCPRKFQQQGQQPHRQRHWRNGFVASDLKNVNPLLGPLQDNGGLTDTHALLPGNPAVDAARNTACPFTDQRGVLRKDGDKNGSVICDIVAYERNDLTPPKVTTTTPTGSKTGVERHTDLTATFSETMNRATLTTSTFKLFRVNANGSTTQITDVTVSSTTDGLKATLDPFGTTSTTRLTKNTEYEVVVTTGAKDRAGNRLDQNRTQPNNQPMEWVFTTGSS